MGSPISPVVSGLLNAYSIGNLIKRNALNERELKLREQAQNEESAMRQIRAMIELPEVARPVRGGLVDDTLDIGRGLNAPAMDFGQRESAVDDMPGGQPITTPSMNPEVARAVGVIPGEVDVQRLADPAMTRSLGGQQWEFMTRQAREKEALSAERRMLQLLGPDRMAQMQGESHARRSGELSAAQQFTQQDLAQNGIDVPALFGGGKMRITVKEFPEYAQAARFLNPPKTEGDKQRDLAKSPEYQQALSGEIDKIIPSPERREQFKAAARAVLASGDPEAANRLISSFISSENTTDRQTNPEIMAARIQQAAAVAAASTAARMNTQQNVLGAGGTVNDYADRLSRGQVKLTEVPQLLRGPVLRQMEGLNIVTTKQREGLGDLDKARGIIKEIATKAEVVNRKYGLYAVGKGGVQRVMAKLQTDPDAQALQRAQGVLGNLARSISSERGVLTDADVGRVMSLVPQLGDSAIVTKQKIQDLQQFVDNAQNSILNQTNRTFLQDTPMGGKTLDLSKYEK